uniref:Uncharacterized protein n=1 Tax=Acrobeloides nanus TaxID=290746 RepID=A0A914E9Y7_9BILA
MLYEFDSQSEDQKNNRQTAVKIRAIYGEHAITDRDAQKLNSLMKAILMWKIVAISILADRKNKKKKFGKRYGY